MAAAKENCVKFAKDKCLNPFRDARVAVKERKLNWREVGKMINLAWASHGSVTLNLVEEFQLRSWCSTKCLYEVTNHRGSDLLGSDINVDQFPSNGVGNKQLKL